MPKSVLGIDIRDHEVRIVEMIRRGNRIGLVNFGTVGLEALEGSLPDRAGAIKKLMAEKMFASHRAIMGYSTKYSIVKFVDLPVMRHQDEDQIIFFEAKQQIPFPLEDVLWDYGNALISMPSTGSRSAARPKAKFTSRQAILVALKRDSVTGLVDDISKTRLDISALTTSGLALYNLVWHNLANRAGASPAEESPPARVVLEVDLDATNLLILTDKFWLRPIMAGVSHPQELLTQLEHSFSFFRTQFGQELKIGEVLVTGTPPPEFAKLLREHLRVNVEELDPLTGIEITKEITGKINAKSAGRFSVAIGLALQALTAVPSNLNFLPHHLDRLRRGAKKKGAETPVFLAAAFYLIAAGLYGSYLISDYNLKNMKLAHLRERLIDYEFYQDKTTELLKGRDVSEAEIAELRSMIKARSRWLDLLGLIADSAPEGTYIDGISSDKENVVLSGLITDYDELSEFLKSLKASPLLSSAQTLQAVETSLGGEEYISFSLRLVLRR